MKYSMPEIPDLYWVDRITLRCVRCGRLYEDTIPSGNELVKFKEIGGDEERWLPTYGKGGYLYLLKKYIPTHPTNAEISIAVAENFMTQLNKRCEQGKHGNGFEFYRKKTPECLCNSRDLETIEEVTLVNPSLLWLKVSCCPIRKKM